MEELQQLVRLIEKKGRFPVSSLINFLDEESLEIKLYNFLRDNKEISDNSAINYIYKTHEKKEAFKMLKSRFRKKLYNQLYFLRNDSFSELFSSGVNCRKLIEESNFLFHLQEYGLAEKRTLQAIKTARQFFLTTEIVQGLELYQKILVDGYYNKQKYEKCVSDLKENYQILYCEREANAIYNEFFINVKAGIESRQSISTDLNEKLTKMSSLWEKSGSPKIFKQYYKVKMTIFELTGRFNEQISFINEAISLYNSGKIVPFYFSLPYNKFVLSYACLRAKNYVEGLQAAEEVMSMAEKKTFNWFANLENYFLLNLHSKRYKEAGAIAQEVLSDSFFSKLDNVVQERWFLFADFHWLIYNDKSNYKYQNVTIINKDKKGFNIWLIILDFLTFLKKGKYDELYREAERIRKYMSKYLETNADPRNRYFLKLLMLVVREGFDLSRIKSNSRYLYNKLINTPPAGDAYAEVEIVPFEHLWEYILDSLSIQKVKATSS